MELEERKSGLVVPKEKPALPEPSSTFNVPAGIHMVGTTSYTQNLENVIRAIHKSPEGRVLGVIPYDGVPFRGGWVVVYRGPAKLSFEELC